MRAFLLDPLHVTVHIELTSKGDSQMTIVSKEHYELIEMFEKIYTGPRLDKEDKSYWAKGNVYQSGEVNALFLAFRHGAAYGKSL